MKRKNNNCYHNIKQLNLLTILIILLIKEIMMSIYINKRELKM